MSTLSGTWMLDALCRQIGGDEIFFPDPGQSGSEAKSVCVVCPVRADCLSFAMRAESGLYGHSSRWGVYGGLSANERCILAAKGWKPGAPTPPVRNAPGRCDDCGKRFVNVDQHRQSVHVGEAS
jgi:WhiB family redox-sensing transcriptional regulator